jgi:hypothetical protein
VNRLKSYAEGEWIEGTGKATDLIHAVTGEKIGEATSEGLDFKGMLDYARDVGNPSMRKLTFRANTQGDGKVSSRAKGRVLSDVGSYGRYEDR